MVDYTIIGSGAGGSAIALQLLKQGKSVEIFEEGNFYNSDFFKKKKTDLLFDVWRNNGFIPITGSPNIVYSEGVAVGGTSVINGGIITRTANNIIDSWRAHHGLDIFNIKNITRNYESNERMLNVSLANNQGNYSSRLLEIGAKKLGLSTKQAPRAVINCVNSNHCALGCPSGAKQSLDKTFLKEIVSLGGKIYSNKKLEKIFFRRNSVNEIQVFNKEDKSFFNKSIKNLILCAGPIQTPKILLKNKIIPRAHPLQFHANLKILALYPYEVNSYNSTIFTKHINEFEDYGVLMMSSNYIEPFLAAGLNNYKMQSIEYFMKNSFRGAIFNVQIKLDDSYANLINNNFLRIFFMKWKLSQKDFFKIIKYLKKLSEVIFMGGAQEIYLPINKAQPCLRLDESFKQLSISKKNDLEINSVHGMSTCSISKKIINNFISPEGRINNVSNLFVADASILPTNTGQHPQNIIMAATTELGRLKQ
jgi:choline dehydrogenase-like flavoprotein